MSQATRMGSGAGMARAMGGEKKQHANPMACRGRMATRRTLERLQRDGAAAGGELGQDSWRTDPQGISGVARPPGV